MKTRIEYIDAARGLAIFTVVYSHIALFCTHGYDSSAIIDFLRTYFLNAFFFIAGFVAVSKSDKPFIFLSAVGTKTIRLLIPTLIVAVIYGISHHIPILKILTHDAKCGYWFTFVLYEMFLLLFLIRLANKRNKPHVSECLMFILGILLYIVGKSKILQGDGWDILSFGNLCYYFIYFVVGFFVSSYKPFINRMLSINRGGVITILAIIVMVGYLYPIPLLINNFATLGCVICILKRLFAAKESLPLMNNIRKGLLILGSYTLEIYFIHYFLLFPLPESINTYFIQLSQSSRSLSFPEFLVIGSIVILICIGCIIISNLLKKIPYFSLLLFGKYDS